MSETMTVSHAKSSVVRSSLFYSPLFMDAIPSIGSEAVQQRLDHVRTYYELLNMPYEALIAFIIEHEHLFTAAEYVNLLKVQVPGREIPPDAQDRISEILSH